MNSLLSETLRQVRKRPQFPQVFLGRDGRPVKDCRSAFNNACKRSGISDFRFHDLRHTLDSQLVMGGTDIMTVKELLGHNTLQMTLRYSHLSQGHKKKAVESVSAILSGHYLDTKP
jgi:integrase